MTSTSSSLQRFDWETAVARDPDLQRIDAFVQRTIAKLPGSAPPPTSASRGSRYAPPLKSERPDSTASTASTSGTPAMASTRRATTNVNANANASPQFINPRDYMSESSSEVDMREVNPMDELSDFESDASQQQQQEQQEKELDQQQDQDQDQDQEPMDGAAADHDVEMDADAEEDAEAQDKNQTVCEVCRSSERERDIVLCDDCDAEYHVFCLSPPLPEVPEGTWYCPKCRGKYPDFEAAAGVRVKAEQLRSAGGAAAESAGVAQANETTNGGETANTAAPAPSGETEAADGGDGPASIPIIQALEENPESSNSLLIHACNCDDVKCADPEFHVFCPHMKRFLRSVCWASHSDKWRSYRLARVTAELFAYHAMNCKLEQCNVPLCVKIREEEIV